MFIRSLLAVILAISGLAVASEEVNEQKNINNQQLSKRPYSSTVDKTEKFEGDTLKEENPAAEKNYKTLQLHMLSKRPYAVKSD